MRVGFDLDEVVVNLTREFERHLKDKYNIYWPIEKFKLYGLNNSVYTDDKDRNKEIVKELVGLVDDPDFQSAASPCEGAVQALGFIKKLGHEIFFLSSRPCANYKSTVRWVRKYNIPFDGVEVIGKTAEKGPFGQKLKLDMYVDDLEKHLVSMSVYKKTWKKGLLLFDRPWNVNNTRFNRIKDWKEIMNCVESVN